MAKGQTLAPGAAEIERLAEAAIAAMPEHFRRHLANVVLQVEDFADEDVLKSLGIDNEFDLTGLYSGRSLDKQDSWVSGELPSMIHLYRRPLLDEWADTGVALEDLITHVIVHEVGHHFGYSDAEMHAIEEQEGLSLLDLAGVTARRGGRILFEGLDLALGPGDAALVTGPNGVGKSSLLRIVAGLLAPAAGRVEAAHAALADEHLALDERQTLAAALGFWTRLDGGEAGPALAAMGLDGLAKVPVRILSTGQRKRATLARVIASGAPLWLLDEPGNGLDADGQERLAAAMAAHRAGGGAILAATHQPLGLDGARNVTLT